MFIVPRTRGDQGAPGEHRQTNLPGRRAIRGIGSVPQRNAVLASRPAASAGASAGPEGKPTKGASRTPDRATTGLDRSAPPRPATSTGPTAAQHQPAQQHPRTRPRSRRVGAPSRLINGSSDRRPDGHVDQDCRRSNPTSRRQWSAARPGTALAQRQNTAHPNALVMRHVRSRQCSAK